MSVKLRRQLYIPPFQIDTNLLNAKQKLPEVNQLEKWANDEVILINMSSTARNESLAGNNQLRVQKANTHIFTVSESIDEDDPLYRRIESYIFPDGAKDENQKNDIRIVCEAQKYQAILVTNDGGSKKQPGGILGNRDKFRDRVMVMNPMEALQHIRMHIQERDRIARQVSIAEGCPPPFWVGMD
ncbi:hypothetical protein G6728_07205 [Polynucleobacter paneuropaeus]|nr:hypothetical protein G6728_07205 [Polynucleobacter paneuropaeus]